MPTDTPEPSETTGPPATPGPGARTAPLTASGPAGPPGPSEPPGSVEAFRGARTAGGVPGGEAARAVGGVEGGREAVVCERLVYSFGEARAVDGLELVVREGEVFGLLGPNGAGKTTAIRCITTLLPVPAGTVRVFGHDAARERMAVRRLLGYVPQQLSADSGLTGRENVVLFARVFDVPRRERAARVGQALAAVGLADAADRLAGTYSGGMVRRLELAQALVSAPRLLILDEPTIGLDPIARTGVWEHIDAVRAATGMTVLVTTHSMDEADQYCDRVGLMHRGRVRALGTPAALRRGLAERQGTDRLPTLEDVFRDVAGSGLDDRSGGGFRDVRSTRRTARRVG
ncbi:ABC transporter ATP-binding protein [Streptomyces sp. NRRL B-3648]|uniref:ABC transporter ATP-binding protein n=1 Tax=Streptomyces sp. NRRL B-3648 TaxID=1519493 RepID=UPI000AD1560C